MVVTLSLVKSYTYKGEKRVGRQINKKVLESLYFEGKNMNIILFKYTCSSG